jgi:hypothetical protein
VCLVRGAVVGVKVRLDSRFRGNDEIDSLMAM